jgi:hypothetical protein
MGQPAGHSAADAASPSWTTRDRVAWTAVETSHSAPLGYWRECAHSGAKRILDAWPYIGLITIPVAIVFLIRGDFFARDVPQQVLALAAGSHEYQRRLRHSWSAGEARK